MRLTCVAEPLKRTLPVTGWFLTAPFLGAYGKSAQDGYVVPAALTAGKSWAAALPVALVLRSLARGYMPATSFIVVSLLATGTILIGWRTALAAATTPEVRTILPSPLGLSDVLAACNSRLAQAPHGHFANLEKERYQ
jgi:hypothetical protein